MEQFITTSCAMPMIRDVKNIYNQKESKSFDSVMMRLKIILMTWFDGFFLSVVLSDWRYFFILSTTLFRQRSSSVTVPWALKETTPSRQRLRSSVEMLLYPLLPKHQDSHSVRVGGEISSSKPKPHTDQLIHRFIRRTAIRHWALQRLDAIFDAKKNTALGDELELLSLLIEQYEKEKYLIAFPDPIAAIQFRMEQMGYKQKDLAEIIGLKSRVSEILNRKRKLTLDMIRKLHIAMGIPTEVLVREYWEEDLITSPVKSLTQQALKLWSWVTPKMT